MALKRDWRRVSAASATLSAGALVFFVAGTGPASADTRSAVSGQTECKLGKLLCGLLGGGAGTPAAPPKPSVGTSTKPSSKPKPMPKPAAKPAPAHHGSSGSSAGGSAGAPLPVGGGIPDIPVPDSTQTPALPDVTNQDPLVLPEAGPDGQAPSARLVAESSPEGNTVPPLLVATASGLAGAIAALNLSVLRRRRGD
jgi:hypothetical protein